MSTLFVSPCAGLGWFPHLPPEIGAVMYPQDALQVCEYYDRLILFNGMLDRWYFETPFLMHPRAAVYIWDPMCDTANAPSEELLDFLTQYYKVFTFDRADADAYGLQYAGPVYWPQELPEAAQAADLLFLGQDKDRLQQLRDTRQTVKNGKLKPSFHVVAHGIAAEKATDWYLGPDHMTYEAYLARLAGANAVLEIIQDGQSGCSQRAMEALFYGRKLVTNNAAVTQEAFYCPENVFILGQDKNLAAWLKRACLPVEDAVRDLYRADNWADRIFEEGT